jgi:hypothetical protein
MATQVSLNSGAVASAGALAIQTNGTTQAVSISTGQVATLAQNPILTSGTANGVAYLNGSKAVTSGSALVFDGTNLGLGVTPSATSSGVKSFEMQGVGSGLVSFGSADTVVTAGAFFSATGWKYSVSSSAVSYYYQSAGKHQWFNAASGTAGNALTATQAMTLDANGSLAVGGTTVVTNNGGITANTTSSGSIATSLAMRNAGTANGSGSYLTFRGVSNTSAEHDYCYLAMVADDTTAKTGSIRFSTTAGSSPVERARITSDGNLLVGTTSASAGSGSAVWNSNNSTWTFRVNSAASSNPNGLLITYSAASPNSSGDQFIYCADSGSTQRMSVRSNGGIANFSANDVNLSDRREKTNFAPAKSYLDVICAIPVQTFNYIDQNLAEDDGLTLGVVAQDVQAVAPEMVMESNWGTEDKPKMRLSIYQTDLQYALMKCIQEQQSLITTLTARITALESA